MNIFGCKITTTCQRYGVELNVGPFPIGRPLPDLRDLIREAQVYHQAAAACNPWRKGGQEPDRRKAKPARCGCRRKPYQEWTVADGYLPKGQEPKSGPHFDRKGDFPTREQLWEIVKALREQGEVHNGFIEGFQYELGLIAKRKPRMGWRK